MAKWWEKDTTFQRPGLFCDQEGILFSSWFIILSQAWSCRGHNGMPLASLLAYCKQLWQPPTTRQKSVFWWSTIWRIMFSKLTQFAEGSWLQWEESVNFAQSSVVNAKCFNKSSMQLQLNVVSGLNNVQWENII